MNAPAPAPVSALLQDVHTAHLAGLAIVPTMSGEKRPLTEWRAYQTRRADGPTLGQWFRTADTLGVICGPKPDDADPTVAAMPGVECIDFDDADTYADVLAHSDVAGLREIVARVTDGYSEATPSGGAHWLYRCDVVDGNQALARVVDPATGHPRVLIETRGRGGFVVTAPTPGYARESGGFDAIATITPAERQTLLPYLRSFDRVSSPPRDPKPLRDDRSRGDAPRVGDDFNQRTLWDDVLGPHGWTRVFTGRDGITRWRRPGKDHGVSATSGLGDSDLLYVFTTSTPLDAGESYTKFGAYAALDHGGDFTAATRALATQGYGPADRRAHRLPSGTDASVIEDGFARDEHGRIDRSRLDNIREALRQLQIAVTFDEFSRVVRLNGGPIDDAAIDRLWVQIDDAFEFRPSVDVLVRLLNADAHATAVHPVRAYLDGLRWDGMPRLDRWLIDYAGADDTPYVRAVGALPLLAAVRRVRQPGAKFDELLILEGAQGTDKSSALLALCPDPAWFTDTLPLGADPKITIEQTTGRWLVEAGELHGMRVREAEALKRFLSSVEDSARLAYGRLTTSVRRQFVVIGSTNAHNAYLADSTGGRRFWPVRVRPFDLARLQQDRDQLWAEASAREAAGASIRLDRALWAAAGIEQEARRAADPWEDILEPLFTGDGLTAPTRVSVASVWQALGVDARQRDNRAANRIAAIAQRFGFAKRQLRIDGQPVRCWLREEAE